MAVRGAKPVVDDDDDFELVTSARQLSKPRPLRVTEARVPGWPTANGKGAKFLEHELSAGEFADMISEGWNKDKDGNRTFYDNDNSDFRFLAHTTRDQHRNRIWTSVEDAIEALRPLGRSDMKILTDAANEANSAKHVSAEKNSDQTATVS